MVILGIAFCAKLYCFVWSYLVWIIMTYNAQMILVDGEFDMTNFDITYME